MSQVQACSYHPAIQTRLVCTECEVPVCPKCMVQCEVGHKCRNCLGKRQSHTMQVSLSHLLTAGFSGLAAGYLFGHSAFEGFNYLSGGYTLIGSLFICYFAGRWLGQWIHSLCKHKMGRKISVTLTGSLIAGLIVSPFHNLWLSFIAMATAGSGNADFYGGFPIVLLTVAAAVFIAQVRQPFDNH